MMRTALIFALLLATIHAVCSQPDEEPRESKKTHGKIQFECQAAPWIWGEDGQDYRLECAGEIPPGKSGVATFDWQDNLGTDTRIRSTVLGVAALNGTLGEGENRVSVHTTFLRDDAPVPTCQSKRRLLLTFNRTVPVNIELKRGVEDDDDGKAHGKPPVKRKWEGKDGEYDSSEGLEDRYDVAYGKGDDYNTYRSEDSYRAELQSDHAQLATKYDEWDGSEDAVDAELAAWGDHSKECPHKVNDPDKVDSSGAKKSHNYEDSYKSSDSKEYKDAKASVSAVPAQTANRKRATPGGLRAVVKCKSATDQLPSNGNCIVLLRLRVLFNGGFRMVDNLNRIEAAAARLVDNQDYTCRAVTYVDLLNNLDTLELNSGIGRTVPTQACFPPFPAGAGRRRLAQAEASQVEPAQSGAATIPAGALWDDVAYARATRASRYTSTIQGCLPGQPTPGGAPRTWETVSSWGGPAFNPDCGSCFKDGINYGPGLGGPPVGWETPPFGLPIVGRPFSYRDAAIVLTDTDIAPEGPSIIVLFRATVTAIQATQWASNVGTCLIRAGNTLPISTTNAQAGRVCRLA